MPIWHIYSVFNILVQYRMGTQMVNVIETRDSEAVPIIKVAKYVSSFSVLLSGKH